MKILFYTMLCALILCSPKCFGRDDESIVWKYKTNGRVYASPVIEDTIMYIGSLDSCMYAFNIKTGDTIWRYETTNQIRTNVAIYDTILCFAAGEKLLGLSKSGNLLWEFLLCSQPFTNSHDDWDDFNSSPLLVDTIAYIGSDYGLFFGVNVLNGDTVMHYQTPGATHTIESTPVYFEGKAYFGDWDGVFFCVNVETEELVWSYDTKDDGTFAWVNAIQTRSVIYEDQVLFSGRCSRLYSLNIETGSRKWMTIDAGGVWILGGLVLEDTVVYAGSSNQFVLQAFNVKTGEYIWRVPVDYRIYGTPFIGQDHYIVGTGMEPTNPYGSLFLINKSDQQIKERLRVGGQLHSSPLMVDSVIYFGCADQYVYAVSYPALLNKLRPHTYIEDTEPTELGEVNNSEPITAEIEVFNDGEAMDSIQTICQNENVQFDPDVFLLNNGSSQNVTITFAAPQMSPGIYYINVVFKSCNSINEDRIIKRYNLTILDPNSVNDNEQSLNTVLGQNYPNPFVEETSIPINVTESGFTKVQINDMAGKTVAVIYEGFMNEGAQVLAFDSRNLVPGLYACELITGKGKESIIMERIDK